ncbi:3-phosphoshikimate 1-carboxyvinyltransferase [Gleimia sp. 6138-11-ORH1]|uniref:3-phosphoshikimate 1-carboxyvinyltransferase n=1 Tax=Gleimia sp. 6138-11-ORH1 TaxID=2973937 RepID=UPI002166E749|nr:3-phosphoshikimate 1-carboxyvinyltransferase [Gleimia sp. 6138-11-ORH1]MCS4484070.1 3-phosphoshikimate 1-carboxyvinyltransferase [Gleimia sp. 6138-11-ORH1]
MTKSLSFSAGTAETSPVPAESTSIFPPETASDFFWPAPRLTAQASDDSQQLTDRSLLFSTTAPALSIPGSKSQTNRALLLAALSATPSQLTNLLWARDTLLMKAGLEKLGAKFTELSDGLVEVTPIKPDSLEETVTIDCGLAGTVMRFLPMIAAGFQIPITFTADPQANQRPLKPLLQVLSELGAKIDFHGEATFPFTICGPITSFPTKLTVDAQASSQFFSALLLGLPFIYPPGHDLTITSVYPPSIPHIEMTIAELNAYGINAVLETANSSSPQPRAQRTLVASVRTGLPCPAQLMRAIEVDTTTAMVFIAASAFTKRPVTIANWPAVSYQPGDAFLEILPYFGLIAQKSKSALSATTLLVSPGSTGTAVGEETIDLSDFGELLPVAVALATQLPHPTTFTGVGHLRGHETDRLQALANELNKLGIGCQVKAACLRVIPPVERISSWDKPVVLKTYQDHRMAMFATLMGLKYPVLVENVATTAKTLPNFPHLWEGFILGSSPTSPEADKGGSLEPT